MSRYWQFAQLSDRYKDHNDIDNVPRDGPGQLFIGGLKAIDRPDILSEHGITHILSVLEYDPCDWEEFTTYERLWIAGEDHSSQNLLQHFDRTNAFIEQALSADSTVLVHCAMGVSRSATIVCAFLMYKHRLTFLEALARLQQARPLCAPNTGFAEQLELHERILNAQTGEDRRAIHNDWLTKHTGDAKL
jgi:dual specificity phosphatase 12